MVISETKYTTQDLYREISHGEGSLPRPTTPKDLMELRTHPDSEQPFKYV